MGLAQAVLLVCLKMEVKIGSLLLTDLWLLIDFLLALQALVIAQPGLALLPSVTLQTQHNVSQ